MKYFFLLLFPFSALAGEAQLACDLERAKAETIATIAQAPQVQAQVGRDPASGIKNVQIGVFQSFAGRSRATKIRDAAELKCQTFRAAVTLDDFARNAAVQVEKDAAVAELAVLERAISLASTNIELLQAQLTAGTVTLTQVVDAQLQLTAFHARKSELQKVIAQISIPQPDINLSQLVFNLRELEGQAAKMLALAQSDNGWDVIISAGGRKPMDTGQTSAFVTFGVRYSFGMAASRDAADLVGGTTEALLAAQGNGYTQTMLRQQRIYQGLVESESTRQNAISSMLRELEKIQVSIHDLDTALALNAQRSILLQMRVLEAEFSGSKTRQTGYISILEQLK